MPTKNIAVVVHIKSDFESWDSLSHLMLIVKLEEKFQIKFKDDELVSLVDFKSICQIVSKK